MTIFVAGRWELEELVAYQGNPDCTNPSCRRASSEPGCGDYHCPRCHEPCGMTGHSECREPA